LQDLATMFGGGRRAIDFYLAIGQSADVRNEVITSLKLVGSSALYPNLADTQVRLEKLVAVQSLPGGVVVVEARSHNRAEALALTDGYMTAISRRLRSLNDDQLVTKRSLLDERMGEAQARLNDAESRLAGFRRANRISAIPEAELGASLSLRTALEAQLQARQVELQAIEQFLGPENPRLIAVQQEIGELRRRLAQSVGSAQGAAGPGAVGLTELSNDYLNLLRDYAFAQSVYQVYTRLSEEVAVDELSGRTASTVQVIEKPHVDPTRHFNVPAVAGLALLALLALFTEFYAPATGIQLWRRREQVPA